MKMVAVASMGLVCSGMDGTVYLPKVSTGMRKQVQSVMVGESG
jgi:hypothetical protein